MKRLSVLIFLLFISVFILRYFGSSVTRIKNPIKWELVWKDDFSKKSLNTKVWGYMDRRNDGCRNYQSSDNHCYEIKNKNIVIKTFPNTYNTQDSAKFLTGGISTRFKKEFIPPCRVDVRAKLRNSSGVSAGIWLMPFSPQKAWPAEGEIDIMEHSGLSDYITQTVHTDYTKRDSKARPQRYTKVNVKSTEYNIYTVEILSDKIIFYVNNNKTLSYPKIQGNDDQFPFFHDWYLLMNLSIHRSELKNLRIDKLPAEMEVDWVKYYRPKGMK